MRRRHWIAAALLALPCCAGCSGGAKEVPGAEAPQGVLRVYVVNHPLELFARRIGGAEVEVVFPAPRGVDPARWTPDAETVAAFQSAELILLNGAGYAGWTRTASLPRAAQVDTGAGFRERLLDRDGRVTHTHGPDGEHDHADMAFTTWLDPTLAAEQAAAVADALSRARPEAETAFRSREEALRREIDEIDHALAEAADALGGAPVLFSHPVYDYLARRYGLDARSLHWEPGEVPDADAWRELDEILADHPARLMVWEDTPRDQVRSALHERGIESVVLRPSGNRPAEGDFLSELREGAARLRAATAAS